MGKLTLCGLITLAPALAQIAAYRVPHEIASLAPGRAESRIGNSVDAATGAFVYARPVMSLQGARSLDFFVTYNSLMAPDPTFISTMGPGWAHPFEGRVVENGGGIVTVQYMHQRYRFEAKPGCGPGQICPTVIRDTEFRALDEGARYDSLIRSALSGQYIWTRLDGSRYIFRSEGKEILLAQVMNMAGQALNVGRVPQQVAALAGEALEVSEPVTKKKLTLYRHQARLEAVGTPEAAVLFSYNSAGQLSGVASPTRLQRAIAAPGMVPFTGTTLEVPLTVEPTTYPSLGLAGSIAVEGITVLHPNAEQVRTYLISPRGTTVEVTTATAIVLPGALASNPRFFAQFTGERISGTWRVRFTVPTPGRGSMTSRPFIRITEPLQWTNYRYGPGSQLILATDGEGNRLFTNTYDASGRVASQDDGVNSNQVTSFSYSYPADGIETLYTDRMGERYLLKHDYQYRLISTTDPLDRTTSYSYSANGDRTSVTDPRGNRIEFGYDEKGNLTRFTDAAGATTEMRFDGERNLTRITDAGRNATTIEWRNAIAEVNGVLRLEPPSAAVTDAMRNVTQLAFTDSFQLASVEIYPQRLEYAYDQKSKGGLLVDMKYEAVNHAGVFLPSPQRAIGYDAAGRPTLMRDVGSHANESSYDASGRPEFLDVSSTLSRRFTYDVRGRKQMEDYVTQGTIRYVEYSYDGNDNLVQIRESEFKGTTLVGRRTNRFFYDGEDRLVATTDADGKTSRFEYDAAGQLVRTTNADGVTATREYDAGGNLTIVRNGAGAIVAQTTYDARGLPLTVKDAAGGVTRFSYDTLGRLIAAEDPAGRVTRRSYDALGRLTKVEHPGRGVFTQTYDSFGNLNRMVGPDPYSVAIRQDYLGRVESVQTPDAQHAQYKHDGRGLLVEETSKEGRKRQYTYSEDGRLSGMLGLGPGSEMERAYAYDGFGNRLTVIDRNTGHAGPIVRLRRTFEFGRMTSYTDGRNRRIDYSYTLGGKLRSMSYPAWNGESQAGRVSYGYSDAGKLTEVTDWAGRKSSYRYDGEGRTVRIDLPNGTWREMKYDAAGRLALRADYGPGGNEIVSFRYRYGRDGKLSNVQTAGPNGATRAPLNASMAYALGNLVTRGSNLSLRWDRDGNLLTVPVMASGGTALGQAVAANASYNVLNELVSAGAMSYSYDEEGRLVGFTRQGQETTLTVSPGPGFSRILDRRDAGGHTRYVWGVGLLYEERGGVLRVYHHDHRGNLVAVTDEQGQVVGRVAYDAHGQIIARDASVTTPFLFGGLYGVLTDPNGLNYMRFRWYSPTLRRFINQDARLGNIAEGASLNRFSYAFGDPMNLVDPEGEWAIFIALGALGGGVVGAVAEVAVQLASGKSLDKLDWGKVGRSALSGAIAGGVTAACGLWCGPYLVPGTFFANAAVSGAASAAESLIEGRPPRAEQVATEALLGGGLSLIGLGRAGGASRRAARELAENAARAKAAVKPARITTLLPHQVEIAAFAVEGVEKGAQSYAGEAGRILADVAVSTAEGLLVNAMFDEEDTPTKTREQTYMSGLGRLAEPRRQSHGRHTHYQLYMKALELANRPIPTNPNNMMAGF